jgi:DNA repair protein RAD5
LLKVFRLRQCVDHPLLVLSKAAEEDEQGDRLLDPDTGDAQGSLKEMIALYAGGLKADSEGHVPHDSSYALQVLKEIGEAEGTSECPICTSEIFDEVLLPCYHRG